ncbi:MAG: sigma-70 family RNA polymerase sigma factor [Patescibacteria group bacterium]|nr:sigma-70 family RNA polymerase sigma factor [Patescibacteria group bacterium]
MAVSEQEFIKAYEKYYGTLVRRFAEKLHQYDCDYRSAAEDLAQETFCRAWTFQSYEGRNHSTLKTWIYTIALNVFRDYLRRRRRKPEILADTGVCQSGFAVVSSPERQAMRQEMVERITFILRDVSAGHRLLFWRRIEEVPYGRIAEELQADENTLKVRVFRMNRRLMAELNPDNLRF